jgi:hypothetical protein
VHTNHKQVHEPCLAESKLAAPDVFYFNTHIMPCYGAAAAHITDGHGLQEELDTNAVDLCQWFIPCAYEEQIDKTPLPKRWYSQDPGT